jgi:hypothetical protein
MYSQCADAPKNVSCATATHVEVASDEEVVVVQSLYGSGETFKCGLGFSAQQGPGVVFAVDAAGPGTLSVSTEGAHSAAQVSLAPPAAFFGSGDMCIDGATEPTCVTSVEIQAPGTVWLYVVKPMNAIDPSSAFALKLHLAP